MTPGGARPRGPSARSAHIVRSTITVRTARANVTVYRNGREVAQLTPRRDAYPTGQTMTIPNTYMTLTGDDFYVLLIDWEPITLSSATFKVYYNPLINWVWGGGMIVIIGTGIAAWPDFSEERRIVRSSRRRPAAAVGD